MENVSLKKHAEEIKAELTPSLERCIKAYMGEPVVSPLANSRYFFENTFLKGPLELFIQRVIEGLYRKGPTVLPLRIGFGFGKTHAEILLLHAFLSPNEIPAEVKDRMKVLGYSEDLVAKTLVLPIDFFSLAFSPFPYLMKF